MGDQDRIAIDVQGDSWELGGFWSKKYEEEGSKKNKNIVVKSNDPQLFVYEYFLKSSW